VAGRRGAGARGALGGAARPNRFAGGAETLLASARRHGVDPLLVKAVILAESAGRRWATSPKGAMGLMQLLPATARRFGVADPFDPAQNVAGGTRYLRWLLDRFGGDVTLALAGYNAGGGAVDRHGGVPPYRETRNYVISVQSNHRLLRRRLAERLARAGRN
jgi:soluble lytic murein transglycosylase-like protein